MNQDMPSGWKACPAGEFARLSTWLRARRRRRDALRVTIGLVLAVMVGSALFQAGQWSREYHFAGISCSHVVALAPDYQMGKLRPDLREQVRRHVSLCPHCKPLFDKMGIVVEAGSSLNVFGAISPSITVRSNPNRAYAGDHSHPLAGSVSEAAASMIVMRHRSPRYTFVSAAARRN
ncbi:MAG: zf-HC2 domain-containing protein [Planctomycetota bacterium]|nr:zf-HC2 domain-containing protein [Planctomycetota bacterium]